MDDGLEIKDYPYPTKALMLIMDLKKEGMVTDDQAKVLSAAIMNYLDLRAEVFHRPKERLGMRDE